MDALTIERFAPGPHRPGRHPMEAFNRERFRYPGAPPGQRPATIADRQRDLCLATDDGEADLVELAQAARLAALAREADRRLIRAIRRVSP